MMVAAADEKKQQINDGSERGSSLFTIFAVDSLASSDDSLITRRRSESETFERSSIVTLMPPATDALLGAVVDSLVQGNSSQ